MIESSCVRVHQHGAAGGCRPSLHGTLPGRHDAIRGETGERGGFANAPPRIIRKRLFAIGPWRYRQRKHIERFFDRIKQMQGLATRYDRRPDCFRAAVKLAEARMSLNAL